MDEGTLARFRVVYDEAFPLVFAYLARRTGDRSMAEDLTQETFAAAVSEVDRRGLGAVTVPWLLGVARHKLADRWRSIEREERRVARWRRERRETVDDEPADRVIAALSALPVSQRAVLVLHYLDDIAVADVARLIERSVSATESLLVRARHGFRVAYGEDLIDA